LAAELIAGFQLAERTSMDKLIVGVQILAGREHQPTEESLEAFCREDASVHCHTRVGTALLAAAEVFKRQSALYRVDADESIDLEDAKLPELRRSLQEALEPAIELVSEAISWQYCERLEGSYDA
jgi:hypothetical protein